MQDMLQHPSWPAVLTNDTHTQNHFVHMQIQMLLIAVTQNNTATQATSHNMGCLEVTMTETATPRSNTFRCHCCELPNHSLGIL